MDQREIWLCHKRFRKTIFISFNRNFLNGVKLVNPSFKMISYHQILLLSSSSFAIPSNTKSKQKELPRDLSDAQPETHGSNTLFILIHRTRLSVQYRHQRRSQSTAMSPGQARIQPGILTEWNTHADDHFTSCFLEITVLLFHERVHGDGKSQRYWIRVGAKGK